jgi:hypothetical protein
MKLPLKSASPATPSRECGLLQVDLFVAMAIFVIAMLPMGYAFDREWHTLKIEYYRGVANEMVDGEMEILTAGGGQSLPEGKQGYTVKSPAMNALPPGHFELIKTGRHLRLSWQPDQPCGLGTITREANAS